MKLEKFKKYGVRNKKIIGSVVGIIILVCGVLLFKSFAFFDSKYDFDVIKGRVPNFTVDDVTLAFTIDGVKSSDAFPIKNGEYAVKCVTCSNGVTAEWNNDLWGLVNVNSNGQKKISCNIDLGTPLYKVVNVGDLVSYTPSSKSYTISKTLTGYSSDQIINPSELDLWRVIKKNEDGTIEMISEYVSSTSVYFYGKTGYDNFLTALDTIAKQYETNGITSGSRYIGPTDTDLIKATMKDEGLKAKKIGTTTYTAYYIANKYREYNGVYSQYKNRFSYVSAEGVLTGTTIYMCQNIGCGDIPDGWEWNIGLNLRLIVKTIMSAPVLIGDGTQSSPYKIN